MGHVTVLGASVDEAMHHAVQIERALGIIA